MTKVVDYFEYLTLLREKMLVCAGMIDEYKSQTASFYRHSYSWEGKTKERIAYDSMIKELETVMRDLNLKRNIYLKMSLESFVFAE